MAGCAKRLLLRPGRGNPSGGRGTRSHRLDCPNRAGCAFRPRVNTSLSFCRPFSRDVGSSLPERRRRARARHRRVSIPSRASPRFCVPPRGPRHAHRVLKRSWASRVRALTRAHPLSLEGLGPRTPSATFCDHQRSCDALLISRTVLMGINWALVSFKLRLVIPRCPQARGEPLVHRRAGDGRSWRRPWCVSGPDAMREGVRLWPAFVEPS